MGMLEKVAMVISIVASGNQSVDQVKKFDVD
jgi:hypothetical protein